MNCVEATIQGGIVTDTGNCSISMMMIIEIITTIIRSLQIWPGSPPPLPEKRLGGGGVSPLQQIPGGISDWQKKNVGIYKVEKHVQMLEIPVLIPDSTILTLDEVWDQ